MPLLPIQRGYFIGLLCGGSDDILRQVKDELLAEYAVDIRHHWVTDRDIGPLPKDVDAVLVMTDITSHNLSRMGVKAAKDSRIKYALIGRKKSAWLNGMRISGFIHKPSWFKPPVNTTTPGPKREVIMFADKPPVTVAAPAPTPVPVFPRLLPIPKRGSGWSEFEVNTLIKLAESWTPNVTPLQFVELFWRATGIYRNFAAHSIRLRGMMFMLKFDHALLHALELASGHGRKKEILERERQVLKRPRAEWPSRISMVAAKQLVRPSQDGLLTPMFDREMGIPTCATADVIRLMDTHVRGTRLTREAWESRILAKLATGAMVRGRILPNGRTTPESVAALDKLLGEGKILASKYGNGTMFRLPGTPEPVRTHPSAGRRFTPAPATPVPLAQAIATLAAAAPGTNGHSKDPKSEARADVFRALRVGEVDAAMAAQLLKALH